MSELRYPIKKNDRAVTIGSTVARFVAGKTPCASHARMRA